RGAARRARATRALPRRPEHPRSEPRRPGRLARRPHGGRGALRALPRGGRCGDDAAGAASLPPLPRLVPHTGDARAHARGDLHAGDPHPGRGLHPDAAPLESAPARGGRALHEAALDGTPQAHPAAHDLAPGRGDARPGRATLCARGARLLPRASGARGGAGGQAGARGVPSQHRSSPAHRAGPGALARRARGSPLPPAAEEFLRAHTRTFLVTLRPDGVPACHPMVGLYHEGALYLTTYRKSAKVRNLTADPRVACVVVTPDDDPEFRGVVLRGRAEILAAGAAMPWTPEAPRPAGTGAGGARLVQSPVAEGKRVGGRVVPDEVRTI